VPRRGRTPGGRRPGRSPRATRRRAPSPARRQGGS
jgi:hypothetical protein